MLGTQRTRSRGSLLPPWSGPEEKSRAAPTIAEVGAQWKAMAEAMDFVGLASLPETQSPFAHFTPLA